ncbi:hypothetical protein Btru_052732 [Bulinus truncatus]|nr:hypothetical protein Btru_052732 [Bulinus truncatus]
MLLVAASVLLLCLTISVSRAYIIMPDMNQRLYIKIGDLNLGSILSFTSSNETTHVCGKNVSSFSPIEMVEAMVFAINTINQRGFLSGIKLGFVIADACSEPLVAAMQAVRFLPKSDPEDYKPTHGTIYRIGGRGHVRTYGDGTGVWLESALESNNFNPISDFSHNDVSLRLPHPAHCLSISPANKNYLQSFDVIGVIGTESSFTTMLVSDILIHCDIPVVSVHATDNRFNDEDLYPILYRMQPPDNNIACAIETFLSDNKWFHFSILIREHDEIEDSYNSIRARLTAKFSCISRVFEVSEDLDYKLLIESILNDNISSRIVIILADTLVMAKIIKATKETQSEGMIVWVGLEHWTTLIAGREAPVGSIGITDAGNYMQGYLQYLRGLNLSNANPWFADAFRDLLKCTESACVSEYLRNIKQIPNLTSSMYNAVMVFGYALKDFLRTVCRGERSKHAVSCFQRNRHRFPPFIANVTFNESSEWIYFTRERYLRKSFAIYQAVGRSNESMVQIAYHNWKNVSMIRLREMDLSVYRFNLSYLDPNAYCTPPCRSNETTIYISSCCYMCRFCAKNEIVSDSKRQCVPCPKLHWPQVVSSNLTVCAPIEPYYLNFYARVSILLLSLSGLFTLSVLVAGYLYWRNRENQIVKASNIELSMGQLVCFLTGYLAIPVLLLKPSYASCTIGILMFTASFNNSYMLMLIKAMRVYRIFTASLRAVRRVSFTQTRFVLGASVSYLVFEVSLFFSISYFYPMEVRTYQPDSDENYTETSCVVPAIHMVSFLMIDFMLLVMSAILAFKTRVLPATYRDSHLVTICIVTTIILWSAFLPVFFLSRQYQSMILSIMFAILINHTVTFTCIFLTRLHEALTQAPHYEFY